MTRALIILTVLITFISCSRVTREIREYRAEYKADFLKDPRSPLKEEDMEKLDFFAPSSRAQVTARFTLTPEEKPFEMATYSGVMRKYRKWGEATFSWGRREATLALYENLSLLSSPEYKDYLFLPFKDETNSVSSYGGGRYLNMSKKDTEDGTITIDFNKSYNPWCAFSDGFNCPIPPLQNHLQFPVRAGEKNYKGTYIALGH